MSDAEYTPTTKDMRFAYARFPSTLGDIKARAAEFDRWLAAHDAEVAAKAWDEGVAAYDAVLGEQFPDLVNPYRVTKEKNDRD